MSTISVIFSLTDFEKGSYLMSRFNDAVFCTWAEKKIKPYPKNWDVFFCHATDSNSTLAMLTNASFIDFVKQNKPKFIYVFKNSFLIEKEAAKLDLRLLNPPSKLVEEIEGKISQISFFEKLKNSFPEFIIATPEECEYEDIKKVLGEKRFLVPQPLGRNGTRSLGVPRDDNHQLIAQFNTSHSGAGTFLLTEKMWQEWQQKFPKRPVRLSRFIIGENITVNLVVLPQVVLVGNSSIQLTGLSELTDQPFTTVGNSYTQIDTNQKTNKHKLEQINLLSTRVGEILQEKNFFGPAGIDFVYDKNADKLYLIEVNARQPASMNLENWLVKINGGRPMLDNMIDFWQGKIIRSKQNVTKISGGQVVLRARADWHGVLKQVPQTGIYEIKNFAVNFIASRIILENNNEYLIFTAPLGKNVKPGEEILKIQTGKNFFLPNGEFTEEMRGMIEFVNSEVKL